LCSFLRPSEYFDHTVIGGRWLGKESQGALAQAGRERNARKKQFIRYDPADCVTSDQARSEDSLFAANIKLALALRKPIGIRLSTGLQEARMPDPEVSAQPNDSMENDAPFPFHDVKEREFDQIASRRECFKLHVPRGEHTLGLAISGGGIRSATFSLGILQTLAQRKILEHLDYLSTVSGGGYIGSWLVSWIRGKQPERLESAPGLCEKAFAGFRCVAKALAGECAGEQAPSARANEEAPEIAFLRMYSNYLTPRKSFFDADTWVVSAIWTRNTLLNLAILVALFASLVLIVRGLGLFALQFVWPDQDYELIWALVCALPLVPMVYLVGQNLRRTSEIALKKRPPGNREGESSNGLVILFCLFLLTSAILYSIWLGRAQCLFVNDTLWRGVRSNFLLLWPAFFFLQWCANLYDCHVTKQREVRDAPPGAKPTFKDKWGAGIPYVFAPLGAAFVTAALLRLIAFLFNGVYPDMWAPGRPWFILTWGPPLALATFTIGTIVHIGLMGRDLPEASREWLGRLRGLLIIYTAGWIIVVGIAVYGAWIVALIGVWSPMVIASLGSGWIASTAAGLFAGNSDKTSGKPDPSGKRSFSVLEIVATLGPYIFLFGFMLLISFGAHAILVHNLQVPRTAPPQSTIEKYDLKVASGNIKLSRNEKQVSDTGFEWLRDRYWAHLGATEAFVSDTQHRWLFSGLVPLLLLLAGAGALLSWRVDINVFSMHNFYKNRLVRCYLGASRRKQRRPSPFTGFDDFDDRPLDRFTTALGYYGPYPIINATLNVTSGGKLQYQERQAESFIFTPLYTGFSAETVVNEMRLGDRSGMSLATYQQDSGDRDDDDDQDAGEKPTAQLYDWDQERACAYRPSKVAGGRVSVGMAMAISGAAVSPNMGYHTSTVVSFLLTVFNVRLGWWLGNALKKTFRSPGPFIGLPYALQELFGMANADRGYVNLSDGGHFDNMGIYELVRRKCRYIICCDGEQDAELTFNGIGNAIRKCRTDFRVDIDLPIAPLQKVNGFSSAHCVVGTINYPHAPKGYLLYLKATLTGDEATDIVEYHARQPQFPHQSTGDQWFDESQFESYRKLGQHIAEKALASLELGTGGTDRKTFFEDLSRIWYPPSAAVDKNSPAHTEMYSRILDAIRREEKATALDPALFEGFGRGEGWEHNTGHLCNSLIQLMQRVFYDLGLEDRANWEHPYVGGWIDIFCHWVVTEPFEKAWAVTKQSYPERFCSFYEELARRARERGKCTTDQV
jgi:hypothetical protein